MLRLGGRSATDAAGERAAIEQWQAKRLASLTSDTGWLTLAGLFWLKAGKNTFGSGAIECAAARQRRRLRRRPVRS